MPINRLKRFDGFIYRRDLVIKYKIHNVMAFHTALMHIEHIVQGARGCLAILFEEGTIFHSLFLMPMQYVLGFYYMRSRPAGHCGMCSDIVMVADGHFAPTVGRLPSSISAL